MEASGASRKRLPVRLWHRVSSTRRRWSGPSHIARDQGEPLHRVLPKLGLVSETRLAEILSRELKLELVQGSDYPLTAILPDVLRPRFLKSYGVIPLEERNDALALAMVDPLNDHAANAVRLIAGKSVLRRVAVPAELEAAIDRLYEQPGEGGELRAGDEHAIEEDVERLRDLASEAPVIRTVNQIIARAVEQRASDIHIEPLAGRLRVRFRIDGVLRESEAPASNLRAAIVSRIKIMANLNIAERRLPQDGRINLVTRGSAIDLRISTLPTIHGESVVIRVLDRSSVALDFEGLGFDGPALESYLSIIERPHGIVLVTGPTGSGKTTTLYASLLHVNSTEKNVMSVEDPIEYQLDGVNQVHVKPEIGLDFANVLRSLLRHDPDIMMVGEIRDRETAEISVQAALTGHLVFSTLHTNNAAGTITRLLDMGVESFLLTSTLNGVAAQRLVRKLCLACRESYTALPELVDRLGLVKYRPNGELQLYRARGCEVCGGAGFFGRTSIFETLIIDDEIRRLILNRAETQQLQAAAVAAGMRTAYDNGMAKVLAGITTVEEVLRVTRND